MSTLTRQPAENVSAFTVGGTSWIADLDNATVTMEVKDEDASAARDMDEYAWPTKRRTQIEADIAVSATAAVMFVVGNSVTLIYTTAGVAYTGQFLVQQGVHTLTNGALQKQRIVLKSQGTITVAAPGP